jgi:uncharacterized protein
MHPLIEQHRAQIAAICRGLGVRRLEAFGSVLREDFDRAESDIDVVVEFDPGVVGSPLRRYFELKAQLEQLFGRPVDIVELDAMQESRLKRIIERSKIPVYAAAA